MLGLLPLSVAPLGFAEVVDPDQADLIATQLLGLDNRTLALTGLDTRTIAILAIDSRAFTLPEGTNLNLIPSVVNIYVDEDESVYEDDNEDIYIVI